MMSPTRGLLCSLFVAIGLLVIGGGVMFISTAAGEALLGLGVGMLVAGPIIIAMIAARDQLHSECKVEGSTFWIDLWRATPHALRLSGFRDRSDRFKG